MARYDVVVVGGGISGLSLGVRAARTGRQVAVVEKSPRPGGCLNTRRIPSGFWFELGAHTCYNSYESLIELIDALNIRSKVARRIPTKLRFFDGAVLLPGNNLGALIRLLSLRELICAVPRAFGGSKEGQTIASYYSRIVGPSNFARVLGPLLSAVPSQRADDFPADMLFKSRKSRRKDYPRSFTLSGGLMTVAEAMSECPGVTFLSGKGAIRVSHGNGQFSVTLEGGEVLQAPLLGLAVPPSVAATLLAPVNPVIAATVSQIREVCVESVGVVVRCEEVKLPVSMFIVPLTGGFHSAVSRDSIPDPARRSFTFHFSAGGRLDERLQIVSRVLGADSRSFEEIVENMTRLPAPTLGHQDLIRRIDSQLSGTSLAITGNWFDGLAIEDCVRRSAREWKRLEAL